MKIRNGYVSNSSSSSFIINGTKTTCVDVAINMIPQLYDKYNDEYKDDVTLYIERLKKFDHNSLGIFFERSDDLIIIKHGTKIYVDATYHVDWDIEYEESGEFDNFYEYMYSSDIYFPAIDNKVVGKLFDDETDSKLLKKYNTDRIFVYKCENKECTNKSRYIVKENQIFCPNCLTDINGNKVAFRKDKLKRIIDDE